MRQNELFGWRYWIIRIGLFGSLGLLFANIVRITVIRGGFYQQLARENRIYETEIPAGRGLVTDRKGRVVAKSVYQYFRMDGDNKLYESSGDYSGLKFEGKNLAYDLKRNYPYGGSMGLVTGYIGVPTDDNLKADKCGQKIHPDSMLGKTGVESFFDCDLRGVEGKRLIEVDAKGKYVRELGRQEPTMGKNVSLSIDAFWQDKIYKMLGGKKAVVIMSEPKTGKIITLVSSPSFDPNAFSYLQDNDQIKRYLDDHEGLPLLNRAIGARYHPGSVFKIAVATAGLESRVIDTNKTYEDTGFIKVGDYMYTNWLWTKKGTTDGMVDIVKGIQRSNDIFFYKLGGELGVDRIKKYADLYGYGAKTGVEVGGEVTGIIPDETWKLAAKGEKWFLGNTYHMSIGQGDVDSTPLQVNQMTNVVAEGGMKCNMTVLKDKTPECHDLGLKKDTINTVIEGMKAACKPGGTAWPLFNFKTQLACKTGTAEVGDGSRDTHAWLTAFGPVDNPQISITAMVERGGEGSDVAAPIVGDILKEWFDEPNTKVPRYDAMGKVVSE